MIEPQVLQYMKDVCKLPARKIFHNAQYDVGWLRNMGIEVNGEIVDTMIAAGIIDENRWSYSCLLYTSPSPRDRTRSRMPSSA